MKMRGYEHSVDFENQMPQTDETVAAASNGPSCLELVAVTCAKN